MRKIGKMKEDAIVIRHNKLLEARYRLTIQEMRLVLWLISEIQQGDEDFKPYRLRIEDLANFVGFSLEGGKTYREIAEVTGRLRTRALDIEDMDTGELIQATWLASARYYWKQGYVDLKLAPDLIPYLLKLKDRYKGMYLRHLLSLKSIYSVRLYDLLKQYENIGSRTIDIALLREYCKIPDDDYKYYKDLRVWVVDSARREINEKTDIFFDYEEIKTGRKVTSLQFTIKKNKNDQKQAVEIIDAIPEAIKEESPYLKKLIAHGVLRATAKRLISEHKPEVIAYNIGQLERNLKAKRGKKIENPAGWLIKAIEEDRGEQKSIFDEQQEIAKKAKAEAIRKRKERISEIEPIVTKIRNDYHKYVNSTICAVIDGMKRDDRITIERKFNDYLKTQKGAMIFASRFDGGGGQSWVADAMVRQYAIKYLSEHCPDFIIHEQSAYAKRHGIENFEELEREYKELTK